MQEIIAVEPAKLLADSSNPRVIEEGLGQREVLLAIAKAVGDEIVVLARDIVQYQSVDPSALPIASGARQPTLFSSDEADRAV
jgi:hypothetical protein